MKKILVVSQYYYPEQFTITHICEQLVVDGFEVEVLTGIPNYPMGDVFNGYENRHYEEDINHVKIHRVPICTRKQGMIKNYFSFAFNAFREIGKLKDDFDIVFVFEVSPITQVFPAWWYKKRKNGNSKLVVYCQDIWPEVLIEAGINKKSIKFKIAYIISQFLYRKSDQILLSSPLFAKYLNEEFQIKDSKMSYLPSYGDKWTLDVHRIDSSDHLIHILFAGNIGKAQNLTLVIEAVKKCKTIDKFVIDIVGDGTQLNNLILLTKKYHLEKNILFHGRKKKEELFDFYNQASAFLLTLKCDTKLSYTIPAKLQGYMGAGKPIIASLKGGAEQIINESNAGLLAEYNDPKVLARVIDDYVENEKMYQVLGNNGRKYFNQYFNEGVFFKKLEQVLE